MSREEAHKILDKLIDLKYTGSLSLNFFNGGITATEAKYGIKTVEQLITVAIM